MKIGFELEYFCFDKQGEACLVPAGLPFDECGWLVEVRSEPHIDLRKAIYLLKSEMEAVEVRAKNMGYTLGCQPLFPISRELKVKVARAHGKGLLRYKNIYGHETHRNKTTEATASLHISFTNEKTFYYKNDDKSSQVFKYPGFIDHAKIITGLDRAFKTELKASKINPGFYEVKDDGRIEYRSLPNNVDLTKVFDVLGTLLGV